MMAIPDSFSETLLIHAGTEKLWQVLTDATLMAAWLGDPSMQIRVSTSWQLHSPILISGSYHGRFTNKGTILAYDHGKRLSYSHLSSVSRLPDLPENYSILEFSLTEASAGTGLTILLRNFPTETIYKHLAFYWKSTIRVIKTLAEEGKSTTGSRPR